MFPVPETIVSRVGPAVTTRSCRRASGVGDDRKRV